MLYHEQPSDPWTKYDFKILEAYQILLDETCPQCGNPVWLCHSDDNRVDFKIVKTTCFATKKYMAYQDGKRKKDQRASKEDKAEWGVSTSLRPYIVQNAEGDLPTRVDYYKSLTVE